MGRALVSVGWLWVMLAVGGRLQAQQKPLLAESGRYSIHLLLHKVGVEEYTVTDAGGGRSVMTARSTVSDRGVTRTSVVKLEMGRLFAPVRLEQSDPVKTEQSDPAKPGDGLLTEIKGTSATVVEGAARRRMTVPGVAFVGSGSMPASLQMMMMRYWRWHRQPVRMAMLRASEKALPVEIRLVGHDSFATQGRMVRLTRYTVANIMFGREVVWMNDSGRLVALMTFAGGLPTEELLEGYEQVAPEVVRSGVQQEMLDLADLNHAVPVEASGAYAIVGARLIDGTGAPVVEDSAVIVRDGRIAAAGARGAVKVPAGMRVVHAEGKSLLPGLWEMHSHYSGVEFGPALLAAGVTTARDCGGELEFLTTVKREIERQHALGPRLLLAGLIDSGGPLGFGYVNVKTPGEGMWAVDMYADAGFEQIKVYTQIQADVLRAITEEAHRRGMTVTGHVPAAMNAFEGIEDGMDQINHLQFVTRAMMPEGAEGPVDLNSERAKNLIALLKERHVVVDPTLSWGEMAGHPKNVDVASFEPGINAAPFTLASKFRAMGTAEEDGAKVRERMETNLKVVRALYEAGVAIVPGSDTGLVGYGLDRELELYVQAGMTPMAAIQSATIVSARAMRMEKDSGSVEVGKRADLMLVNGDPTKNISDLRRVVSVVTAGRMYDSKKLGRSVGFSR